MNLGLMYVKTAISKINLKDHQDSRGLKPE